MTSPPPGDLQRDPLQDWLLEARTSTHTAELLLEELANRLVAEGYPLWRLRAAVLAMHPEAFGRAIRWQRGEPVIVERATFDLLVTSAYIGSPVQKIHLGADLVRCRLDVPEDQLAFPHVLELKQQGGTDYAIYAVKFSDGRRSFLSIASNDKAGFTDAQIERFQRLLPLLSLRLELESANFSTTSLLHVYLGKNAAERVLKGAFRRGSGELIRAAIWMCDLRGFTSLVDHTPVQEVVPVLDQYFECVARPVTARGGEILKFIGDAMLAVFPVEQDAAAACRNAVEAARAALNDFAAHEVARKHKLHIGVAVNLGEVSYGNIGASDRLDFTVIGAAVNEASRMESLCKALKTPLVIAENVAEHLERTERISLGSHLLRGVATARELFTLPEFAPERMGPQAEDPVSVS